MTTPPHVAKLLNALNNVSIQGDGWQCQCPAHEDRKASLSVGIGDDGRALIHCHAGCTTQDIMAKLGFRMADLFAPSQNENRQRRQGKGPVATTYDYLDETGVLLFQSVRHSPKEFSQRQPDGPGRWIWNLKSVRRVLYRLPELIGADRSQWVFLPEGEKDVDRLIALGLIATTNPMGAGKWMNEYAAVLQDRRVCVLPDNDQAGRDHANDVAQSLIEIATDVKILALPGLPNKGDVSDWLNNGGTRERLLELLGVTPTYELRPQPSLQRVALDEKDDLPTIDASVRELKVIAAQAWAAIAKANDPPRFFRCAGVPSRIESDDDGAPITRALTKDRLRHELARIANWKVVKKQGDSWVEIMVEPPKVLVDDILATADPPLPILNRIVEAPVFSPSGILQTAPGYHPASRSYLMGDLDIGAIPTSLTKDEIQRNRDLFLIQLMGEFPFVGDADLAHALALAILPYVRDMIDGPTPLHLFEAPEAGTGKGLLVDVLLRSAIGRHVGLMAEADSDEEWRKRITANLLEGRAALVIDNLSRPLDSGVVAAALTALRWDDRLLGKTETVHVPVRCAWVATGNNPVLTTEIGRRCIRIRLDAKQDRPWTRAGFKIGNLRQWADTHRTDLVRAALTLIQAWIAAGQPRHTKRLGSFESWSEVVGGILDVAEVPGFLANLNEFYEQSDRQGAVLREFIERWWEKFTDRPVGTKELFPIAQEMDGFDLGKGQEKSQRTVFGKILAKQRDRVIGAYRIVNAGKDHKASQWKLLAGNVENIGERFHGTAHTRAGDENDVMKREGKTFPDLPHVPRKEDVPF